MIFSGKHSQESTNKWLQVKLLNILGYKKMCQPTGLLYTNNGQSECKDKKSTVLTIERTKQEINYVYNKKAIKRTKQEINCVYNKKERNNEKTKTMPLNLTKEAQDL